MLGRSTLQLHSRPVVQNSVKVLGVGESALDTRDVACDGKVLQAISLGLTGPRLRIQTMNAWMVHLIYSTAI